VVTVHGNPTWSFLFRKLIKISHPQNVKPVVINNTRMSPVSDNLSFAVFSKLVGGPRGRWLIKRHGSTGPGYALTANVGYQVVAFVVMGAILAAFG
jgi:hypothetical protein